MIQEAVEIEEKKLKTIFEFIIDKKKGYETQIRHFKQICKKQEFFESKSAQFLAQNYQYFWKIVNQTPALISNESLSVKYRTSLIEIIPYVANCKICPEKVYKFFDALGHLIVNPDTKMLGYKGMKMLLQYSSGIRFHKIQKLLNSWPNVEEMRFHMLEIMKERSQIYFQTSIPLKLLMEFVSKSKKLKKLQVFSSILGPLQKAELDQFVVKLFLIDYYQLTTELLQILGLQNRHKLLTTTPFLSVFIKCIRTFRLEKATDKQKSIIGVNICQILQYYFQAGKQQMLIKSDGFKQALFKLITLQSKDDFFYGVQFLRDLNKYEIYKQNSQQAQFLQQIFATTPLMEVLLNMFTLDDSDLMMAIFQVFSVYSYQHEKGKESRNFQMFEKYQFFPLCLRFCLFRSKDYSRLSYQYLVQTAVVVIDSYEKRDVTLWEQYRKNFLEGQYQPEGQQTVNYWQYKDYLIGLIKEQIQLGPQNVLMGQNVQFFGYLLKYLYPQVVNQNSIMELLKYPQVNQQMMDGQMMDGQMMNGQMMNGQMMDGQMMDGQMMDEEQIVLEPETIDQQ